ncbi:Werner syndrome ATP-dependent helicase-like protein [Elysia marginata]|uniref:DNA 3'-5' helicase n=1 Tax=Elysia marginata TaxID=1093978 RepID=A0AAV4GYM2_9GAST|nr:Werner syndrome ATP-dependent helicase-like protein [Elysia marginata]
MDLFKVIQFTGSRFGLGVPCQVLTGSYSKKIQQFQASKVFGSGKYKSLKFWSALGRSLLYEGYLKEKSLQSGYGCTVEMTPKAESWYNKVKQGKPEDCPLIISPSGDLLQVEQAQRAKSVSITIKPQPRLVQETSFPRFAASPTKTPGATSLAPPKPAPSVPAVDEKTAKLQTDLYGKLVKSRNDLAQETGFTPHNIASNRVLLDLARFRPGSKASLLKIEDFSEVKVDRFGDVFVKLIKSFCEQHSLEVDNFPALNSDVCGDGSEDLKADLMKITETQRQTYIMFVLHGKPVEEVASQRGIKTSTVITHLSEALKEGLSVDIRKLGVTLHMERMITDAVWAPPVNGVTSSLTKIKDQLPTYIEYNHIKLVVSSLTARHGLETNSNGDLKLKGHSCPVASETPVVVTEVDVLDDSDLALKGHDTPPISRKRSYNLSFSNESPSAMLRKSLTSPDNRSDLLASATNQTQSTSKLRTDSQSLLQSESFEATSLNENIYSQSQSQTQSSARKLPAWMSSSGNKSVFKKKMKSNSLFK